MSNWGTEVRYSDARGVNAANNVDWLRKCSLVEQELRRVHEEVDLLEQMMAPGKSNTTAITERFHNTMKSVEKLRAKVMELDELTSHFGYDSGGEKKARTRRLQDQALQELRRVQSLSGKLQATLKRDQRASLSSSGDQSTLNPPGTGAGGGYNQQHQMARMASMSAEEEAAMAQERDMSRLEGDIVQVNEIFTTLAGMVHEQGEMVNSIEANTELAHTETAVGVEELGKAVQHRNSARKKKIIIVVIVLVVLAVIGLIIGLSIKFS